MKESDQNESNSSEETIFAQVKKFRKELNSGTVSLMLLSILADADQAMYGYQIAKRLEHLSAELKSQVDDSTTLHSGEKQGSLYPVLRNLNTKGLLESHVEPSESGPPRRYFKISKLGEKVLQQWLLSWQQTKALVNYVIGDHDAK